MRGSSGSGSGRARVAVMSSLSAEGPRRQRDVVVRREDGPPPPPAPAPHASTPAPAVPAFATPTPTPPPTPPPPSARRTLRRIRLQRPPQPSSDQNEKPKTQPLQHTVAWELPKREASKASVTGRKIPKLGASEEEALADEVEAEGERETEGDNEEEEEKENDPSAGASPLPPSPPPGSPTSSGPEAVPATSASDVRAYDPQRYVLPQEAEPQTTHSYDWRRYAAPEASRLGKSWERNGLDHGQAVCMSLLSLHSCHCP